MAVDEERLEAAAKNSVEKKESKGTNDTFPGTWHGGAERGSIWICYAGSLAEKRKTEILDKWRRPTPIPWEKNSLGN